MPETAGASNRPGQFWRWLPVIVVVVAVLVVFCFDPRQYHLLPACVFQSLTGWNCPGCGTTRAVHDLLHGRLIQAVRDNALIIICLPWLAWWLVAYALQRQGPGFSSRLVWGLSLLVAGFVLWRNLPAGAWWNP